MRTSIPLASATLMVLGGTAGAGVAWADKPANANGWGTVVSQKATTGHAIGEHVSAQPKPHQGLGNVARTDGAPGDHPGDHGCFVGGIDGDPNTACAGAPGRPR